MDGVAQLTPSTKGGQKKEKNIKRPPPSALRLFYLLLTVGL